MGKREGLSHFCYCSQWMGWCLFFLWGWSGLIAHAQLAPAGWVIRGEALLSYKLGESMQIHQHAEEANVVYGTVYAAEVKQGADVLHVAPHQSVRLVFWLFNNGNTPLEFDGGVQAETNKLSNLKLGLNDEKGELSALTDKSFTVPAGEKKAVFVTGVLAAGAAHGADFPLTLSLQSKQGAPFIVNGKAQDKINVNTRVLVSNEKLSFKAQRVLLKHRLPGNDQMGVIHYRLRVTTAGKTGSGKDQNNNDLTGDKLRFLDFYPDWITAIEVINTGRLVHPEARLSQGQRVRNEVSIDDVDFQIDQRPNQVQLELPKGIESHHEMSWELKLHYHKTAKPYIEGIQLNTRLYAVGENVSGWSVISRSMDHYTEIQAPVAVTAKGYSASKIGFGEYEGDTHAVNAGLQGDAIHFTGQIENRSVVADTFYVSVENTSFPDGTLFFLSFSEKSEEAHRSQRIKTPVLKENEQQNVFVTAQLPALMKQFNAQGYQAELTIHSARDRSVARFVTLALGHIEPAQVDLTYNEVVGQANKNTDIDPYHQSQDVTAARIQHVNQAGDKAVFSFFIYNQFDRQRTFYLNAYKDAQLLGRRPYRSVFGVLGWDAAFSLSLKGPPIETLTLGARQGKKLFLSLTVPQSQQKNTRVPVSVVAGDVMTLDSEQVTNDALKFFVNIGEPSKLLFVPSERSAAIEKDGAVTYRYQLRNDYDEVKHVLLSQASEQSWPSIIAAVIPSEKTADVVRLGEQWRIALAAKTSAVISINVSAPSDQTEGATDLLTLTGTTVADDGRELNEPQILTARAMTHLVKPQWQFKKLVAKGKNPADSDFKASLDNVKPGDLVTWKGVVTNKSHQPAKGVSVTDSVPAFMSLTEGSGSAKIEGKPAIPGRNVKVAVYGPHVQLTFYLGEQSEDLKPGVLQPGQETTYTYQVKVDG